MIYKASGLNSTEIYSRREYRSVELVSAPQIRIPTECVPDSLENLLFIIFLNLQIRSEKAPAPVDKKPDYIFSFNFKSEISFLKLTGFSDVLICP